MAVANFNARAQINQGRQQSNRRVELHYRCDFNVIGAAAGAGLAQNLDIVIGDLPLGYVHERLDAVLRTAEGAAATLDVGTEALPTLFANALNMNGTINAKIQPETVAAADATDLATVLTLANEIKADLNRILAAAATYRHSTAEIRVRNPGATTLDDAIVDLTFVGYMRDTTLEK